MHNDEGFVLGWYVRTLSGWRIPKKMNGCCCNFSTTPGEPIVIVIVVVNETTGFSNTITSTITFLKSCPDLLRSNVLLA